MALYSCPDCGEPVSSESLVCPKCGWRQKKSKAPMGCLIAGSIGFALVFAFFYFAPNSKDIPARESPTVSAGDNQAAAPATALDQNDPALQPAGTYSFQITATGGTMPVISGTTSVPDGTVLVINIKKPWLPDGQERITRGLAACGDNCLPATGPAGESLGVDAVVKDGAFSAGPFSFANQPFPPGNYPLEIFI